ncbi:uncharacterized protein LOC110976864 isoform X1 [Acanthaster planci]|uniref:Uncharacterized protein LOC110976864 isoform X1 n=1 Tax=Acanthaster planci TaxID=133434 RepID=A0A8B7XZ74_ACAPL|nr:uncharacterized protein LOC110976864 isoform X1 [Acanthaster planci]
MVLNIILLNSQIGKMTLYCKLFAAELSNQMQRDVYNAFTCAQQIWAAGFSSQAEWWPCHSASPIFQNKIHYFFAISRNLISSSHSRHYIASVHLVFVMAETVKREYETALSDLTFNSKPLISMLTMLAEENVKHAPQIVEVIESRLQKAKPSEKLPVLYLMDSIIKNVKGAYLEAFTPNVVQTFCGVFEKVDEKTRQSLFKLRMTWASYFTHTKLYALDLKVKELDPAWPIVADPTTTSHPAAIHVNPKFIKKPQATVAATKTSQPAATTQATSVQLSGEELAERKKKESERQEMEMRQQLLKKQEQLLQLQQKRLEFELQQTQSKLEEQAMELKQKNEQILLQQQVLQQQQHQAAAAAAAAAATWPGTPQPSLMWPAGHPVLPGQNGPAMILAHDPSIMPMHAKQQQAQHQAQQQAQQQVYLPPPPMPPFGQQMVPPMQSVLPTQQVPPVQQGTQAAPATRDPRIARDPRLARRDPRTRGAADAFPTVPTSTAPTAPAVATVPPVQSTAQGPAMSVAQPLSMSLATSDGVSQAITNQQLKSVVTVAPSQPTPKPTPKLHTKKDDAAKDSKATDSKQPADQLRETKPDAKPKPSDKDLKSEVKPKESKGTDSNTEGQKSKIEGPAKQEKSKDVKSNDRSPRRSSDEKRDLRSDSKNRERGSREPERRTSRDSKKDFDKRDSWPSRDRDSRERDRDYRDRPKERIIGSREPSRIGSSRRKSNRSRSRSRSPVARSRSPRGSDKVRTTTRGAPKADKFGRDLPRPVKETKEEKKPEPASDIRKKDADIRKKDDDSHKKDLDNISNKDIDERVKSQRGSKENVPVVKEENKPALGRSEKRRSPSTTPVKETEKEPESKEDAPSKRPRLEEAPPKKPPLPKKTPDSKDQDSRQKEKTPNPDNRADDKPLRPRPLMELPPPRPFLEPSGRGSDHPLDGLEYEREMISPPGGWRERPLPRRRLSIDPGVRIPKELSLDKHAFILEQAEKQLLSGELTHQQHQELLRELFELHQIQRQQKDDEHMQRHPNDSQFRRHYPDDPRVPHHPRSHTDPRKGGMWPRERDIDHRRSSAQDVDMRVFDPGHPLHAPATKSRGEDPVKPGIKSTDEPLKLPSVDQDDRTRNHVQKDRDDRVKTQLTENEPQRPPLKSILKSGKPTNPPLESPLSPEPEEKCGSDAVVKTVVDAVSETREKDTDQSGKEDQPETVAEDKESDALDESKGTASEVMETKDTEGTEETGKGKGKKKNRKKKKKGSGSEAEVHVEISAFEENLEIKPPVFKENKVQPLMDMDERRNSTDNESANVLPAPFREADDLEDLFPAGKDCDERQGPGRPVNPDRDSMRSREVPLPPREGPSHRDHPPRINQIREDHPRDPRLCKGAPEIELRDNLPRPGPLRDGILGDLPARIPHGEPVPRNHPQRERYFDEVSREGPFRDRPRREGPFWEGPHKDHLLRRSPPREFREGPPREGQLRGGPRDGPFRDCPPRDGPFRNEHGREQPFREGPPREGPFRDCQLRDGLPRHGLFRDILPGWTLYDDDIPREGPYREGHPREGLFREGHPREGLIRGQFRDDPFRDGRHRVGPPRGSFPDDLGREGQFRESPPRDGPFREGPPGEGSFRRRVPREGPYREGLFGDDFEQEVPDRGSPPRKGFFKDGPPFERFRGRLPPHDRPHREGSFREGIPLEGPLRDGPPREGSFRDQFRRSPLRGEQFREGPPARFPRDGPLRDFEEDRDPRRGPPRDRDPRQERYHAQQEEIKPKPLKTDFPGEVPSTIERFEGPQRGGPTREGPGPLLRMKDRDERQLLLLDQKPAEHSLVPLPMETQDEPSISTELSVPLPHSQAQHLPVVNPTLNLPAGLGMPSIGVLPFQVLGGPATSLQGPHPLGLGLVPATSILQGAGLPPMSLSQAGGQRPIMVPGVQAVPQQFPGVIRPTTMSEKEPQQGVLDPRGLPQPGQMAAPGTLNPARMGAPHLMLSENPQGTPPPQQAAPLDVSALFAKLVATGIIPPTRSDSPVVQGTETPPPTVGKEESEPTVAEQNENTFVPELGFYPEELKCRYEGVINRIYTGTQCSSCGMRFVVDEMDRYRKHLDWHFRQNRRDKDGMKAAQNRKWFYEVGQWLDFEEINDMDEERSNFFEAMALQARTDKDGVHCVAVDAGVEGDEMCSLCHEPFEQFFDEDEEVWKLKDAVRFNRRTYHPGCYEDAKDAFLLETPTPGEDGLHTSFDAMVSPLSAYSQRSASLGIQLESPEKLTGAPKDNNNEPSGQTITQLQSAYPKREVGNDVNVPTAPPQSTDQPKNTESQQVDVAAVVPVSTDQSLGPQSVVTAVVPASTDQPVGTQSVVTAVVPASTNQPLGTQSVVTAVVPASTDQPVGTQSVVTAVVSASTDQPVGTQSVVTAVVPASTDQPVGTHNVVEAVVPASTDKLVGPQSVAAAAVPTLTDQPVGSQIVVAAVVPASTEQPVGPQSVVAAVVPASTDQPVGSQSVVAAVVPESTDQLVGPQNDSSTGIEQSADLHVNSQTTARTEGADQPMETSVIAEPTVLVKQELIETGVDSGVKMECLVDPEVKMEVDEPEARANSYPQSVEAAEKMEVDDAQAVPQDSAIVENVPAAESTSETASSAETVVKEEPVDNVGQPETAPESALETTVEAAARPEAVEPSPSEFFPSLMPEQSPASTGAASEPPSTKLLSKIEPRDVQKGACDEAKPGQERETSVSSDPACKAKTQQSQPEAKAPSTSQKEAGTDAKESTDSVAKPSQTDSDKQSLSKTTAVNEVQNIQAISVIGRARVDTQRRRDMFYR